MRKILPKTLKNSQGFTLIELMVAIAIVAILATIGLTIFLGTQKSARDTKRRADLDAVSKAFETHYLSVPAVCDGDTTNTTQTQPTYCPLQASWFTGNVVPTDPLGSGQQVYCINSNDTGTTIADPTMGTGLKTDCTILGTGWAPLGTSVPAAPTNSWKVCSFLESNTNVLCEGSQQT